MKTILIFNIFFGCLIMGQETYYFDKTTLKIVLAITIINTILLIYSLKKLSNEYRKRQINS